MQTTIFHAFNMNYNKIAELAPTLKRLGISHVQFPPVQTTRTLSEYDGELLRQQIKLRDAHLAHFYNLCVEARHKSTAHPGHTFDHILKHRLYYINQPLLRTMYEYLLDGVAMDDLLKHTYERLHTIDSPVVHAFLDIEAGGKRHPWYDLVIAADYVLSGVNPLSDIDSINNVEHRLNYYSTIRKEAQEVIASYKKVQQEPPIENLKKYNDARKQYAKLYIIKKTNEKAYELGKLVEKTKQIRNMIKQTDPKSYSRVGSAYKESYVQTLINRIYLYELIMFPPWWLIYQPMRLELGNTFLGSADDIRASITACKAHGLRIIVDIVVNNLAATAGERADWAPVARHAPANARTLADIPDISDSPVVARLRTLLHGAFDTDDLGLVTVPHACEQGREPTQCWMSQALPQLNQAHPAVISAQETFLASLAAAGVDGVRIDAAAHLTPADCQRIITTFNAFRGGDDVSYIEYVGGSESWRAYPFSAYDQVARLEDFDIGESLYTGVFGPQADLERTKNYGGLRLRRYPNLDSVVVLVNHDHVMGSIPSALYTDLPSQISYELSLAYLIQRVYGHVLLMPHDLSSEFVLRAVLLRAAMRNVGGVWREHVDVRGTTMTSYKFDASGTTRFISTFDLESLSFDWRIADESSQIVCKFYNSQHTTWMRRCYIGSRRGQTQRAAAAKTQKRNTTRRKPKITIDGV